MAIFSYLVAGILVALGIARYNKSSKLFWMLFTSFVLGIAGGSLYQKVTDSDKEEEKTVIDCGQASISVTTAPSIYCLIEDVKEPIEKIGTVHKNITHRLLGVGQGNYPGGTFNHQNNLVCLHISTQVDNLGNSRSQTIIKLNHL